MRGAIAGNVMCRNLLKGPAPSTEAASYVVGEIDESPPKRISAIKGVFFQKSENITIPNSEIFVACQFTVIPNIIRKELA
jgi:hypothetical protein